MNLLPFENITISTRLSEDEVINRLNDIVEPQKTFRLGLVGNSSTKPYEGEVSGKQFNIKRIIGYRNSFLPRISGTIQRDLNTTTINVKMRLHILVILFLIIWCVGVGLGFIIFMSSSAGNQEFDPAALIPLGMLVFVYAMTMGGFKFESIKSKKHLTEIFDGQIEDNG